MATTSKLKSEPVDELESFCIVEADPIAVGLGDEEHVQVRRVGHTVGGCQVVISDAAQSGVAHALYAHYLLGRIHRTLLQPCLSQVQSQVLGRLFVKVPNRTVKIDCSVFLILFK